MILATSANWAGSLGYKINKFLRLTPNPRVSIFKRKSTPKGLILSVSSPSSSPFLFLPPLLSSRLFYPILFSSPSFLSSSLLSSLLLSFPPSLSTKKTHVRKHQQSPVKPERCLSRPRACLTSLLPEFNPPGTEGGWGELTLRFHSHLHSHTMEDKGPMMSHVAQSDGFNEHHKFIFKHFLLHMLKVSISRPSAFRLRLVSKIKWATI